MEHNCFTNKIFIYIFKWLLLGALIGIVCGFIGAVFANAVEYLTALRHNNNFMLFLLLPGGILSVFLYKFFGVSGVSTDSVIASINGEKRITKNIVPAIFGATLISQAFGASVGKEGASLQLGAGIAACFSELFKLNKDETKILTVCGMGAFFAALFGTPIGACIFVVEVAFIGKMLLSAIFPTLLSCYAAFYCSKLLGVKGEYFNVYTIPKLSVNSFYKVILIVVSTIVVGYIFIKLLHFCEKWAAKIVVNEYLRISLGAVLVIILTLIVGNNYYNGAGFHIIHKVMNGEQVNYFAFVLKIVFTVISVAAGFKGGEIVPTLFIGATFGSVMASFLGVDTVFAAAIGMTALLCFLTKCPLACLILAVELFGLKGIIFYLIAVIFSFLPIKKTGFYNSQKCRLYER